MTPLILIKKSVENTFFGNCTGKIGQNHVKFLDGILMRVVSTRNVFALGVF